MTEERASALANRIALLEPIKLKSATGEFKDACIITASEGERDEIVAALRAASRPQEPVAWPFLSSLEKTAKIMRRAHDGGGDRLMSIWTEDVQAVEEAVLALTGEELKPAEMVCPKCGAPDDAIACGDLKCPGAAIPKVSFKSAEGKP